MSMIAINDIPVIERKILDRLRRSGDGCWEWTANLGDSGYGKFMAKRGMTSCAHRLAYMVFCGPIDDGMFVCHRCDNRKCCNPTHLFIGTHLDNMRDRDQKGRTPKGSQLPQWTLSEEQRAAIRREYIPRTPDYGTAALAKKYGIGIGTVHRILNHRTR